MSHIKTMLIVGLGLLNPMVIVYEYLNFRNFSQNIRFISNKDFDTIPMEK